MPLQSALPPLLPIPSCKPTWGPAGLRWHASTRGRRRRRGCERCIPSSRAASSSSAEMTRLVVVGGGRMGHALIGGLLRSGWVDAGEITIAERLAPAREEIARRFPGVVVVTEPVTAASAVLAVKPP